GLASVLRARPVARRTAGANRPAGVVNASGGSARLAPRVWAPSISIGLPALALTAVTVLAAALRFHSLEGVPPNPFYDAAVRSMAHSWHNFFFAAFEPGGRIAVDKPPVDLWLQVASVKLLGFDSLALK